MFGWRRKRDGFEWHEYVRTTILVRRANRRQKVDDARQAAVHGLKDAGAAAAHGLHNAKDAAADGLRKAGRAGQAMGASGAGAAARMAHAAWRASAKGLAAARSSGATGITALAAHAARLAAHLLTPILARLSDRRTRIIVGAVGTAALFAAAYRIWAFGFDMRAVIAALLSVLTLAPALLAEQRRTEATRRVAPRSGGPAVPPAPISWRLVRPVLGYAAFATALVLGLGSLIQPGGIDRLPMTAAITPAPATTSQGTPPPTRPAADGDIAGRARALTGDTLRIARRAIRLDHIEAPEANQTCTHADGRRWRCGEAARTALAALLARARITCTLSDTDDNGIARGDCRIGERDIAAELVSKGHVFAKTGFFARHSSLESEARENRRGLWSGEALRPAEYRAAAWQEAKQKAPDDCPIKGRIAARDKLYVMPWMQGYDRIRIRQSRGERWFCSEEEALQAGWRPSNAS